MDQELVAQLYKDMRRIRRFEEVVQDRQIASYRNREAVAVGVASVIEPDDFVVSSYCCHGIFLARGGTIRGLLELGDSSGFMNIFDIEHRYIGGWSLNGTQAAIAAGFAYAQNHYNVPNITICFITDSDIRNGLVYEISNIAVEWSLPLIFVYEHCHTNLEECKPSHFIAANQESIDGHDLFAVRAAIYSAITRARESHTSTLVEAHIQVLQSEDNCEHDPLYIMSKKLEAFKMNAIREKIDAEIEVELQQALRLVSREA